MTVYETVIVVPGVAVVAEKEYEPDLKYGLVESAKAVCVPDWIKTKDEVINRKAKERASEARNLGRTCFISIKSS
jgi:hypothetical protein